MSTGDEKGRSLSVNVPIGAMAVAVLLAVAAAAYLMSGGESSSENEGAVQRGTRSGRRLWRKFGLMTAVTLIENDATRKVVVAALKAMARRG